MDSFAIVFKNYYTGIVILIIGVNVMLDKQKSNKVQDLENMYKFLDNLDSVDTLVLEDMLFFIDVELRERANDS